MIQNLVLNYCPCFTYPSSFLFTHQNDSDVCREVRHLLFPFYILKSRVSFEVAYCIFIEIGFITVKLLWLKRDLLSCMPLSFPFSHRMQQSIPSWVQTDPSVSSLHTVPTQNNTMTHSFMDNRCRPFLSLHSAHTEHYGSFLHEKQTQTPNSFFRSYYYYYF